MRIDLLAGASYNPAVMPSPVPMILVFDSGLGGLTVFSEVLRARPDARFIYAGDDAAFPYGRLSEEALTARVLSVMERLIGLYEPQLVVVACNTASTIVLPPLRKRFSVPFVGTVPAIKPAALATRTGYVTVLATPGTVARDYTRDLVETYAAGCKVNLVGSRRLAAFAEAELAGSPVPDEDLLAELRPCFMEDEGGRTDVVALGCTHYPLLLPRFQKLAPWAVTWIDPAPAIARRVIQLIGPPVPGHEADENEAIAVFTSGAGITPAYREALRNKGLPAIVVEDIPLHLG
ncbi:glutamate racemase [Microvirga makkahensis]|uniref:Glutamate racemase n=1 Tax=Microvirga makkahensis TaxID=1128670 RepID=A0A7X3SM66_9HYPH|nr:glutamate racemase [Microvirga makkahensis]MXQ09996.1 glutamate racemase [Microvirga makkahensis]